MNNINILVLNNITKYLEFIDLCNLRQVNKWFNKRVIIKTIPRKFNVKFKYFPDLEEISLHGKVEFKNIRLSWY